MPCGVHEHWGMCVLGHMCHGEVHLPCWGMWAMLESVYTGVCVCRSRCAVWGMCVLGCVAVLEYVCHVGCVCVGVCVLCGYVYMLGTCAMWTVSQSGERSTLAGLILWSSSPWSFLSASWLAFLSCCVYCPRQWWLFLLLSVFMASAPGRHHRTVSGIGGRSPPFSGSHATTSLVLAVVSFPVSFMGWGLSICHFFLVHWCPLLLFSCSVVSDSSWPHGLHHTRLPCPSPSPGACSNSCPLSQWCHPTISFSVIPFSSCLQSFPESGSFLVSWLFASGGQRIAASALATVLSIIFRVDFL